MAKPCWAAGYGIAAVLVVVLGVSIVDERPSLGALRRPAASNGEGVHVTTTTTQSMLDEYARGAAARLGEGTLCSVTLSEGGSLHQVASNDARAAACDQAEVRDHAGPCILAMDQLHGVLIHDIDSEDRWPAWRRTALDHGFRAFLALPGHVDDRVTVAVNSYSEQASPPWSAKQIIALDAYVQQLAAHLRGPD